MSVIIQIMVLSFFNYYYLVKNQNVSATSYEFEEEVNGSKKIKVPDGAKDIKVSYNAAYAALLLDGQINIYNMKNNKKIDTIGGVNGEIKYFNWLPDRNFLIYSESNYKMRHVEVITKDVESGIVHNYPMIKGLPKNSYVVDIALSPMTNVVYVKIKTSEEKARIYKYDIMDQSRYIFNISLSSNIGEAYYQDKLVYETYENRVYVWNGRKGISNYLGVKSRGTLLGIDDDDNVYIGEKSESGKISKIYYGGLEAEGKDSCKEIDLKDSYDKEEFIKGKNGIPYILDKDNNCVINILNHDEIKYEGEFIEILNNYIVFLDGKKLKAEMID